MAWKNLKISSKLAIGFGSMLLLIMIGGFVGYSGLKTVGHSLVVISDEEAPLVDASMEMKIALLEAMITMEEYLASTSVIGTADETALAGIIERYKAANLLFDHGVDAILNGGRMGDVEVIKTDNAALASRVREAAELHDSRYQPAAAALMKSGREMIETKADLEQSRTEIVRVFAEVSDSSEALEQLIGAEIGQLVASTNLSRTAMDILTKQMPLADMSMEIKCAVARSELALLEYTASQDPQRLAEYRDKFQYWIDQFDASVRAILDGGLVGGVTVIASENAKVRAAVEQMARNHEVFSTAARQIMADHQTLLSKAQEVDQAMEQLDDAGALAAEILGNVEELIVVEMADAREVGHASSENAIFWQIVVVLSSIGIGGLLGFVITRSLSKPINQGVALADEIAKGDFSQRLNLQQNDEIGRLAAALDGMADNLQHKATLAETIAAGNLNVTVPLASERDQLGLALKNMTDSLNETLGQVQMASEQIASGGDQVAGASQSLSQGATESAASLEEITSSMGEMASRTRHNAENAAQANLLSDKAKLAAEKGSQQMQSMVDAMVDINQSGQSISKIIKTIDEIAFQTNLLALNAAVEAARAGQHGKGFAVVAEEVRNLAARSAKAAEETANLIEGSVEKTANGSQIANQTAEALQEIVGGIGQVSDLISEISAASNDQAEGISQVDEGLNQIDKVTQQNTANAEESAAAAEELSGQAEQLRQMLTRFALRPGLQPQPAVTAPASAVGWADIQPQTTMKPASNALQIDLDDKDFGRY